MGNNYLDEVLPRWQFWKEYLIAKLENYKEACESKDGNWGLSAEKLEKIEKMNAEMIEKVKEIKSRTDLEKIQNEISKWMENLKDCCDWQDPEPAGVYWEDVDNEDKLSSWLSIKWFPYTMNYETNKKITK